MRHDTEDENRLTAVNYPCHHLFPLMFVGTGEVADSFETNHIHGRREVAIPKVRAACSHFENQASTEEYQVIQE